MAIRSSARKGIPHLDNEKFIMDANDFLEVINFIEKNNSTITPKIASVTEKSDGFSLRFGLDNRNKFFIESSHSGPVFDVGAFQAYTKKKFGKGNDISAGYDDILKRFKKHSKINSILKKYNTDSGIKVIGEAFYLPNGKVGETDQDVKFIAITYKRELLGDWATFVLFEVQDGEGKRHPDNDKIIKELKAVSDKNIMFDDSIIRNVKNITIKNEIKQIRKLLKDIEKKEKKSVSEILLDKSRKRTAVQKRKEIKQQIIKFQKKIADRIRKSFIKGKWGPDMEGVVVNVANGIMFKVVSDAFKKAKEEFNQQRLKESKSFKEFYFEENYYDKMDY